MTDTQSPSAPLFSVITVTYNAEDTLPATLASVRSQTFGSFEHIIVDGASRDRTIALAQENAPACQILVSGPDRGLYDAMNKGLGMARGEYVVFLNAGDTFHSSSTLADVADAVMANDFPGVVYGQTDLVDAGRRRIAGYYDMKYRFSADYEWCIRVLQHSRHNCYIDAVLADYLMEGMTTRNRRKSLMERFRIMCYYYGTFSTVMRHIAFIPRFLRRRRLEKKLTR